MLDDISFWRMTTLSSWLEPHGTICSIYNQLLDQWRPIGTQNKANFPSMWADLFLTMTFPPAGQRSSWPKLWWRYISSCGWSCNHKLLPSLWFSQQMVFTTNLLCWRQRIGSASCESQRGELAHEQIAILIAPSQSINLPSSSRNAFCCAHVESRLLQNWAFTFPNRPSTTAFLNRSTTTDFLSFVERNTRRPIKPWTILVHHFNLPLWACREFASDRA